MPRCSDFTGKARFLALTVFFLIALQFVAGWLLSLGYDPKFGAAQSSVLELRNGGWTSFLTRFHYWGSAALILGSLAALCSLAWSGESSNQRKNYFCLLAAFALSFAMQVTGNLLPMDSHDVQTVVIESGIARRTPGGEFVARQMLQGESFGQPTIDAWFFAHRWLLAFPLMAVALLGLRSLKPDRKLMTQSLVACGVLALFSIFVEGPTGAPATQADFVRFDARPCWYTWPMHGALMAFESISPSLAWVGVCAVPAACGLVLFAMPWMSERSRPAARLSLLGVGLALSIFALGFGGSFAPITGSQDVAHVPEKDWGPAEPLDPALAEIGKKLFKEKGCDSCHGIDGSKPTAGPDLTPVHERYPARGFYLEFIPNPKSVRPSTTMPGFGHLKKEEVEALAEFVRSPR